MKIKKAVSLFMCLLIIAGLVPQSVFAYDNASVTYYDVSSYQELSDGNHGASVSTNDEGVQVISIAENVVIRLSGRLIIEKEIIITGGGVIRRADSLTATQMFSVRQGAKLSLNNITIDGGAEWNGNVVSKETNNGVLATYPAFIVVGELVIGNKAVVKNCYNSYYGTTASRGGAVAVGYAADAAIVIDGGKVEDSYSANSGGMLCMYMGSLKLNDAVITGCYAEKNSVIYLKQTDDFVNVSGNTVVENNNNNIKLTGNQSVVVNAKLGSSAKIGLNIEPDGITRVKKYYTNTDAPDKFYDTSKFFTDSQTAFLVSDNNDGLKCVLAENVEAVWKSENAIDCGTFDEAVLKANSVQNSTEIYLFKDYSTQFSSTQPFATFNKNTTLIIPEKVTLTVNAFINIASTANVTIKGGGRILRGSTLTDQQMIKNLGNLYLTDIVLDGGAVWENNVISDITNTGTVSNRPAVLNMHTMVLGKNAIIQNNCNILSEDSARAHQLGGAIMNYCYLPSSGVAFLTVDGGTIKNCYSNSKASAIYSHRAGNTVDGQIVLLDANITSNVTKNGYGAIEYYYSSLSVGKNTVVYNNTSLRSAQLSSGNISIFAGNEFEVREKLDSQAKIGLRINASGGVVASDKLPLAHAAQGYLLTEADAQKIVIDNRTEYIADMVNNKLQLRLLTFLKVNVNKDNSACDASQIPRVLLSLSDSQLESTGTSELQNNTYVFSDLENNVTYYVWAENADGQMEYANTTIDSANSVKTLNYYTLTLQKGEGVDNVSSGGVYLSGKKVKISAALSENNNWGSWSESGDIPSGAFDTIIFDKSSEIFVTITAPLSLLAKATSLPQCEASYVTGEGETVYTDLDTAIKYANTVTDREDITITVYKDIVAPAGGYEINNDSHLKIIIKSYSEKMTIYRSENFVSHSGVLYIASGDVTLENITIDGGAVLSEEGTNLGICADAAAILCFGKLTLNSGATVQNCDNAYSGDNSKYYGGALNMYGENASLVLSGGRVTSSRAKKLGGGVYAKYCKAIYLLSGSIDNNNCEFGGGIYVNKCINVTMKDVCIYSNSASWGSAVYVLNSVMSVDGAKIYENAVLNETSGSMYISGDDAYAEMISGNIYNNSSSGSGGAVTVAFNATFKMCGGLINNNYAETEGGGVRVAGGVFIMTGGRIENNTAGLRGAGVSIRSDNYEYNSYAYVEGSPIICNNTLTSGIKSNVYLSVYATIDVIGKLSDTASIGITVNRYEEYRVTSFGLNDYVITKSDFDKFFLDNSDEYALMQDIDKNQIILMKTKEIDNPDTNDVSLFNILIVFFGAMLIMTVAGKTKKKSKIK